MTPTPSLTLDRASTREPLRVRHVVAPAHAPEWRDWLEDLGFLPGEPVMLMARGVPGGDPLVVRVGLSTFALRRAEAACVEVVGVEVVGVEGVGVEVVGAEGAVP